MPYRIASVDSAIRRWPTPNSRHWTERFLTSADNDENVLAIVAVGSAIRPGVTSLDVDLVVVCRDRGQFKYKAPIEVDLRTFELDRVESELSKGHDLLAWAVKFGAVLFDRQGTWQAVVSNWRHRVPLPDSTLARERAAEVLRHIEAMKEIGDEDAEAELRLSYLTLLARAFLSEAGVFPQSRPELPGQLREIGKRTLADQLELAIRNQVDRESMSVQAV
jgi:predicted nucleotidyltransferase